MIAKHAGLSIATLFHAIRQASAVTAAGAGIAGTGMWAPPPDVEQHRMMAAQLEGHRQATAESIAKQQNLDRMRAYTQSQLGIGLAERGMGYNPMLSGGGGGANAAPFVAWSAQRG